MVNFEIRSFVLNVSGEQQPFERKPLIPETSKLHLYSPNKIVQEGKGTKQIDAKWPKRCENV
jgi:hypothetical protein